MSIDFLTSGSWFGSQIDFLLFLQNIRLHLGPVFDKLFMSITFLGELFVPTFIMCVIYWCFDFCAGVFLFSLNSSVMLTALLLKCIFCVKRPWILSDKIKPVKAAFGGAGGYSFPSGHTSMAASSFGGMAYLFRKNKTVLWSLVLLILFVGFSRMYLGVHTPQDVLTGLILSVIFIFTLSKLIDFCEKDKNRYLYSLAVFDIVLAIILFIILYKSYPLDYVNGKLLVNPLHAKYIAVVYSSWLAGLINGAYLCARFFRFDPKAGSVLSKILRSVIGGIILYICLRIAQIYFFESIADFKLTFACMFSVGFFATAIYPYIFTKFSSK